jgi:uncharacterized protein with von Willebrand factor type A (vWA) domain
MLLRGTGWLMRHDLLVWMAAVGFFAAGEPEDRNAYRRQLNHAVELVGLDTKEDLRELLSKHFPLEPIQPHPVDKLWQAIMERS